MKAQKPARTAPVTSNLCRLFAGALVVSAAASCVEQSAESTETGNPPLVVANPDKIEVSETDGEVTVVGEPGAVEPGRALVVVRNETDGDSVTVRAEADGSFLATVPGSVEDSYTLVAKSSGTSASLDLEAEALGGDDPEGDADARGGPAAEVVNEAGGDEAFCAMNCASPNACDANELFFPVSDCPCDDGGCQCDEAECNERCLIDMQDLRDIGPDCSSAISRIQTCLSALPCEIWKTEDIERVKEIAECRRIRADYAAFSEACYGASSGVCLTGKMSSSAVPMADGGVPPVQSCGISLTCQDEARTVDCVLVDPATEDYTCICHYGVTTTQFNATSPCVEWDDEAAHASFVCGWQLPSQELDPATCEGTDYSSGSEEAPTACHIETRCGEEDLALNCSESEGSVSCDCLRNGELVQRRQLGPQGCAGARSLSGDGPPPDDAVIQALTSICSF